ncbi:MAG TPA: glycosyltransferase family 4 protein [Pyrinomonadaceae bacterium]|jgi:glycosyltransferase involved in cell wall biosynthesis
MLAILTTHPIQYQVPLWQALAKEGSVPFEVWYLTDHGTRPTYDNQFGKTFAWDIDTLSGYPHYFLQVNPNPGVSSFGKLRLNEPLQKRLLDRGITALWVNGWQVAAYWQAVWQAHAAAIPVWLRGESNDLAPPPAIWKKLGKRFWLGQLFHYIRHFLYIGHANRRLYERYGVNKEQLHPAPYSVDNERFARQAELLRPNRKSIRHAWKIPEDAFCVLFAGKFIPKKRPLDLIVAARDRRLAGRPLHLLFVGSGELGYDLRRACHVVFDAESSILDGSGGGSFDAAAPQASFVGFLNQSEISKAYVAADCLVLPSDHGETWGLVVNEAMASGLPCIASDACGCSEDLVAPLNTSFRFPLGDTSAIAEALLSLMMHSCSPSIVQRQVAKFSISTTVNTVKGLYCHY